MASLAQMRQAAKALGVPAATIRAASTAEALNEAITNHMMGGTPAKKTVAKAPAKKAAASRPVKKAPRKAAASTSAPAKSRGAQAKRPTTVTRPRPRGNTGGRNSLGSIDFNETDGWNAREGSAPDRIIAALRRYKGNREKAFALLAEDLWDFTGKVKRDGSKRTKAEAESMLKYRIARTAWDFAIQTGQHEKSSAFGARANGHAPAKAKAAVKAVVKTTPAKKAPASPQKRRGRPPGSKTAQTPTTAVKRGPGRPPGSKNKPKVTPRANSRLGRPAGATKKVVARKKVRG